MAEWKDVIHQIVRICKRQEGDCGTCVLSTEACPNSLRFDTSDEAGFVCLEKTVMSWAAENPEPIYPRWIDWLADVGLIINTADHYAFNFTAAVDQIPADIAQKLGLEPKEIKK